MKKRVYLLVLLCLILLISGCTSPPGANKRITTTPSPRSVSVTASPKATAIPTQLKVYGTDFNSTWGDLIASEGELVYETLTRKQ